MDIKGRHFKQTKRGKIDTAFLAKKGKISIYNPKHPNYKG